MGEPTGKSYSHAHRGSRLEEMIESSNRHYRAAGVAMIEKQEIKKRLVNGRMKYVQKGPPDFIGGLQGRFVAFDTKETGAASFAIKYVNERIHQLHYLLEVEKQGGIAFYLIHMKKHERFFIVTAADMMAAIKRANEGGRKSIAVDEMSAEVGPAPAILLDYLQPWRGKDEL